MYLQVPLQSLPLNEVLIYRFEGELDLLRAVGHHVDRPEVAAPDLLDNVQSVQVEVLGVVRLLLASLQYFEGGHRFLL